MTSTPASIAPSDMRVKSRDRRSCACQTTPPRNVCQQSWPRSFQPAAVPALPIVRSSARLRPRGLVRGLVRLVRSCCTPGPCTKSVGCWREGTIDIASRISEFPDLSFHLKKRKDPTAWKVKSMASYVVTASACMAILLLSAPHAQGLAPFDLDNCNSTHPCW